MQNFVENFMGFNNADEIINRLWLGNYIASTDTDFLLSNNITVVVNCTKDLPFSKLKTIEYKYRIPVNDNLKQSEIHLMYTMIGNIVDIIHDHYLAGRSILIHCHAGMQRSAAVCLVYHIKYHSHDYEVSYNHLKQTRFIVFTPRMNFKPAVIKYLEELN